MKSTLTHALFKLISVAALFSVSFTSQAAAVFHGSGEQTGEFQVYNTLGMLKFNTPSGVMYENTVDHPGLQPGYGGGYVGLSPAALATEFNHAKGWFIETRVNSIQNTNVASWQDYLGVAIGVKDDIVNVALSLRPTGIVITSRTINDVVGIYAYAAPGYHAIRFESVANSMTGILSVDGVKVLNVTLNNKLSGDTPEFVFGDPGSGSDGEAYWDYVSVNTSPVLQPTQPVVSIPLTDGVNAQGVGVISLLKDTNPQGLEGLRQANDGQLVFGFKLNEAKDGTETAQSQGVAVNNNLTLTLTFDDGTQKSYSINDGSCQTQTYSLLSVPGSNARNLAYTLIGSDETKRQGVQNAIQNGMDSTLKCRIPISLATVTGATLNVNFLQTNVTRGDPEAFYDFTGQGEPVSLLNAADTQFIDTYQAGRSLAPAMELTNPAPTPDPLAVNSWNYFPSGNTYYVVAYEDLYPSQGDYDFNDLVVAYQVQYGLNSNNQVVKIAGTAYLLAKGAAYSHDWHLRIGLPSTVKASGTCSTSLAATPQTSFACNGTGSISSTGTADVLMFADTGTLFPNTQFSDYRKVFANTLFGSAYLKGPKSTFSISLDQPVDAKTIGAAPFDPYLYVRNTKQKIQLLQVNPAAKDANGYPFAMLMPSGWKWPYEKTDIRTTYANLANFVGTSGATSANWYNSPAKYQYYPSPQSNAWAW